jgi:hypothetical protein
MLCRKQNTSKDKAGWRSMPVQLSPGSLEFRCALVIEEDEVLRLEVGRRLKERGWLVHGIRRAEQAVPLLGRIPYHLIITDTDFAGSRRNRVCPNAALFKGMEHDSGIGSR